MQLDASVSFLWSVTISLDVILVVLVVRRRVVHSLPFFALFVVISTLRSLVLWATYRWLGFASLPSQDIVWSTQVVLLVGRAAVCAELCWSVLRRSTGLWSVARGVLVAIGVAIAAYAVLDSFRSIFRLYYLFVAAERGLELAVAVVLLSLLLIANRYKVPLQRTHFLLLAGLCFYSLVQTINNAAFYYGLANYFAWWNSFRMVSFQLTQLVWILAFATPESDADDKPLQMVPNMYEEHAEEVSRKLRDLEEDLEEIVRK
jgi:hypothetical protein